MEQSCGHFSSGDVTLKDMDKIDQNESTRYQNKAQTMCTITAT